MTDTPLRVCGVCAAEFVGSRKDRRYCGAACSAEARARRNASRDRSRNASRQRPGRRRPRYIGFAHNQSLLAECRALLAAQLARETEARPTRGRPPSRPTPAPPTPLPEHRAA